MMIKTDILRKIESLLPELSKAQKVIAEYILDYPQDIPKMTVTDLAEHAKSSPATVIRLCQTLKVESFTLLKVEITAALATNVTSEWDVSPDESTEGIKKNLLESAYQSMKDTMHYLTDDILHKASALIESADVLYTFGTGASFLVAENISQKWARIGKVIMATSDPRIMITRLASSTNKAVAILVSHSGRTKEVLIMQEVAKQNGIQTIVLTQLGSNPLASKADVAIQTVKTSETELRSAATASLHVQFLAIDTLFFYYMSTRYGNVFYHIHHTRECIHQLDG